MATLEEEVAGLTQATTDLLTAVNVKKSTLDEKVDTATTQAAISTAGANTATTQAGIATAAKNAAESARDEAVAVVYSGEASLTPAPGKIPLAGADGKIHPSWLDASKLQFAGIAYNTLTDTFIRTGAGEGLPVGQFAGIGISPLLKQLRRVTLKDDGTVYKEISWLDFTKYTDGTDVPLDGSDGQIMVEYQKGYVRTGIVGDWFYLEISPVPLAGFSLHPLFDGVEVAYQGAYEASLVPGETKLSSIALDPRDGTSPVWPVTTRAGDWGHASLTTANTDSLAEARGAGWQQADFWIKHWERCLLLVGWAGYNTQAMIGNGRTALSGGGWTNDIYVGRCGLGDVVSGYSGANNTSGAAGFLTAFSQILGIENPYGNMWERVASLISDHAVYVKGLPPYDYTTVSGWDRLLDHNGSGINLPTANGYAGKPHSGLGLVLPADVTGSSTTKMADYYAQNTGVLVFRVGGGVDGGANAGAFCWNASASAASTYAYVGGRLCFKKVEV